MFKLYNLSKQKYYYSSAEISTDAKSVPVETVNIFPNPAKDWVTFTWSGIYDILQLKLYQVTGARVLKEDISPGTRINMDNLQKGIYLYKLSDENHPVQSGKLVIQ